MKRLRVVTIGVLALAVSWVVATFAQEAKSLDRPWQPVVIDAGAFPQLNSTPVRHLHLFAYRSQQGGGTWERIPYQVDEKDSADFFGRTNGLFDGFDQLVFMVRDMGDKAPPQAWLDDVESRSKPRVEIEVADPAHPARRAWVYLYVTSSITELPPSYGMSAGWAEAP